jgi:hypothetical protein
VSECVCVREREREIKRGRERERVCVWGRFFTCFFLRVGVKLRERREGRGEGREKNGEEEKWKNV